jgi:hypothetical protein
MKSDEGFLNNVGKQMLIQLMNGNVIPFQSDFSEKFKTPETKFSGVFFYLFQGGRKLNLTNLCSLFLTNHMK